MPAIVTPKSSRRPNLGKGRRPRSRYRPSSQRSSALNQAYRARRNESFLHHIIPPRPPPNDRRECQTGLIYATIGRRDRRQAPLRKRGRRPFQEGQAAAKVEAPRQRGGVAQPSTLTEAKRDQTKTATTTAIVTATSRKRAKLLAGGEAGRWTPARIPKPRRG
jgi:hypothetical protein